MSNNNVFRGAKGEAHTHAFEGAESAAKNGNYVAVGTNKTRNKPPKKKSLDIGKLLEIEESDGKELNKNIRKKFEGYRKAHEAANGPQKRKERLNAEKNAKESNNISF
jgi:hypothetical protein